MKVNRIQFQELINTLNLFGVEPVSIQRFKHWLTGTAIKDEPSKDKSYINFLLDISTPSRPNSSGIIFKKKYEYSKEGDEKHLEERFFTYVVESLIKMALTQ